MYAAVLIEYEVKSLDQIFYYVIPLTLRDQLKVGMQVLVPFRERTIRGLVLEITSNYDGTYQLKEIVQIINGEIYFDSELLELGRFLQAKTFCNLVTAYQTMLPTGFKIKKNSRNLAIYQRVVKLKVTKNQARAYMLKHPNADRQEEILDELIAKRPLDFHRISPTALNTLVQAGLVKIDKRQIYRLPSSKAMIKAALKLTADQIQVISAISAAFDHYKTHLIYGVTASGKTEVYFALIDAILKREQNVLVLVPEITLTTQLITRFTERFGCIIAVYHSALSPGERQDEYLKIYRDKARIVIGTRSAVFVPIHNLGLIIIDEEQSTSFKQDTTPRYNAIEMARFRAKFHQIPLVLGSATPSLESMARAENNIYELHKMLHRAQEMQLPPVQLIDMSLEFKKRNYVLSGALKEAIETRLRRREQVILLLNRRGFAPHVRCSNCGYVFKCKNCNVTMTYHKKLHNLQCHYCGYTILEPKLCPSCHASPLLYCGLGTEKLEETIRQMFFDARIVRLDTDTTRIKGNTERIIKSFQAHEFDILIGTQMVSKGLDFPLVTLVGVLSADNSLNWPDFRSPERTFALLNQVSGRAGRSKLGGEVIIQTFNPTNYILQCVVDHDYERFYHYEKNIRHQLNYPPYCFLTSLRVAARLENLAQEEAIKTLKYLKSRLQTKVIILGPTAVTIFKLNNLYRYQIILKYKKETIIDSVLTDLVAIYKTNPKVFIEIDRHPLNI